MPKWGWWLAAVLLFVLWNFDSIGDYWFEGWWTTVRYHPLGDWHAGDLIPFIAAYLAIRPVSDAIASLHKLVREEEPAKESEARAK
jgi:hypothetical protein